MRLYLLLVILCIYNLFTPILDNFLSEVELFKIQNENQIHKLL